MIRTLPAALALLVAGAALAQPAAEAIALRQSEMKAIDGQLRAARAPTATAEQRRAAGAAIHKSLQAFGAAVPAGSGPAAGVTTRAKAEVWSDAANFKAALAESVAAAERASKASDEAAAGAIAELGGTCFACHSRYRA